MDLTPIDLPLTDLGDTTWAAKYVDGDLEMRRSILPGGVRVLTQFVPGTRAVAMGFWVPTGSRDETAQISGASHFLEHLLFKGTARRSALQIASSFDEVGGDSNAATGRESTFFWAQVLDTDAPMALETLTDMVTSSLLQDADVETERGVILDELAMSDDSPAEVGHEAFQLLVHGDNGLGRPIGGTIESVSNLSAPTIREIYRTKYRSNTLIFTAAGNVEHEVICRQLLQELRAANWELAEGTLPEKRRDKYSEYSQPGQAKEQVLNRPGEQAHVFVGGKWFESLHPHSSANTVFSTILGGGMSSRLFQEVREKRGLAYTTYSFSSAYADTGTFGMYAGCAPKNADQVRDILWREVHRMASEGISDNELKRSQGQLIGSMFLGMENSEARMRRLGYAELNGKFIPSDVAAARTQNVTKEDVQQLAQRLVETAPVEVMVLPKGSKGADE